MNDQRLTDVMLARALRDLVPDGAGPDLGSWILAEVRETRQERALPMPFSLLVDADLGARRRNVLLAVALLIVVMLATAAAVGAALQWLQHDRGPDLAVVAPEPTRSFGPEDLAPPNDLDAYMASSYEGMLRLPPLRIVMADGDIISHDGAGTVRIDRPLDGSGGHIAVSWLLSRSWSVEIQGEGPQAAWVVGPPGDHDPRAELFRESTCCAVDATCEPGWRYVGLEHVLGRPTHRVACGAQQRWMDIALGIPLRQRAGDALSPTSTPAAGGADLPPLPTAAPVSSEVAELRVGPQPAEPFACPVCPSAAPSPVTPPAALPRADEQPAPPTDVTGLVTQVRARHGTLPAGVRVVRSYASPASSDESTSRSFWDGVDSNRDEYLEDGVWEVAWLTVNGRTYEFFGGRWHDYGPPSASDVAAWPAGMPDWTFGLPESCPTGWQHQGFDVVQGHAAHHIVCALDEYWIDVDSLLVMRVQHDPDPVGIRTFVEEVVSLEFGPQPPDLFTLPPGADVFCPRCEDPTLGGASARPTRADP